jgi:hypothetical protein
MITISGKTYLTVKVMIYLESLVNLRRIMHSKKWMRRSPTSGGGIFTRIGRRSRRCRKSVTRSKTAWRNTTWRNKTWRKRSGWGEY